MDSRFQDMRAWRPIHRQTDPFTIKCHRQFILSPGQRESQVILTGQHRLVGQFIKKGHKLVIAKPLNVVAMARHQLPRLQQAHGPCTLPSNLIE